jgi:hypothetical protein
MEDDGNNTLIYHAKLTNGSPLPLWLTFDTISGTFAGTPAIIETLNIKVTATDTAGAAASTNFKIMVNNSVSSETINGQHESIMIFPNPTNGPVSIALYSLPGETAIAEVINLQGKAISSNTFKKCIRIDMTNHPKGIYILKLLVDNEITIRKICIQ